MVDNGTGTGNCKVMRIAKRCFYLLLRIIIHFVAIFQVLISIMIILALIIDVGQQKDYKTLSVFVSFWLTLFGVIFGLRFLKQRKFILKGGINKADDLITNIASVIPDIYEIIYLEHNALVYFGDIRGALSSRFSCPIRLMACGSIPERFAAPLGIDWISGITRRMIGHALLSDQDFLIEPSGITASFSAQSRTIEIFQSESFIEEGFAKLRISRSMAERFDLKEGFLSTDTIKKSVKRCISENYKKDFLGNSYYNYSLDTLISFKIHGPVVNVCFQKLLSSVYSADFTFAIPCLAWPPESDWSSREKMWPNQTVATTIKNLGFHFVPKNQENDKSMLTWRYSFSLAERELSKEINEIARKCFLCLKIISADHLKPICKRLKSYHLKTILFRTLEVTSGNMWSEENILNCLDYLLEELRKHFTNRGACIFESVGSIYFKILTIVDYVNLKKRLKRFGKILSPLFLPTYLAAHHLVCHLRKMKNNSLAFAVGFTDMIGFWYLKFKRLGKR